MSCRLGAFWTHPSAATLCNVQKSSLHPTSPPECAQKLWPHAWLSSSPGINKAFPSILRTFRLPSLCGSHPGKPCVIAATALGQSNLRRNKSINAQTMAEEMGASDGAPGRPREGSEQRGSLFKAIRSLLPSCVSWVLSHLIASALCKVPMWQSNRRCHPLLTGTYIGSGENVFQFLIQLNPQLPNDPAVKTQDPCCLPWRRAIKVARRTKVVK